MPRTIHQHMRYQRGTAGKMNEQPLPARLNAVDDLARDGRVVVETRQQRVVRAKAGDRLPNECAAHGAGGAEDSIALGHGLLKFLWRRVSGMRVVMNRHGNATQMQAERSGM